MENKFIEIGNGNIHYTEANKERKEIIFFIHGNSCSSRMWQSQLQSDLLKHFRLIAIDLPGHGKSFASKEPEIDYSPLGTAKILSQIIKDLAAGKPYLLVGFSYGANQVAEMLLYGLKPCGIVLLGPTVLGENHGMDKVFIQQDTPSIFLYNETNESAVSNFLHGQMSLAQSTDIENSIEDYLKVSAEFKPALFKTAAEGKISEEIKELKCLNIPACVIFGQQDKLINADYLDDLPFPVWQNRIYKIPGAGHWVSMDNPEAVNQIVVQYAAERFTATHA